MARSRKWLTLEDVNLHADGAVTATIASGCEAVNFAVVMGELRTGKSYLLNALVGGDTFGTSDQAAACTEGVDVYAAPPSGTAPKQVFADVEGFADKGQEYDLRLRLPMLLFSQVIIINYLCGSGPAKDKVLSDLSAMARLADGDGDVRFGHVHVVLRDCPASEETCRDIIFSEEAVVTEGAEELTNQAKKNRNLMRVDIAKRFASTAVCCLPRLSRAPAPSNYRDADADYQCQIDELRSRIQQQMLHERYVGDSLLTGRFVKHMLAAVQQEVLTQSPWSLLAVVSQAQEKVQSERRWEDARKTAKNVASNVAVAAAAVGGVGASAYAAVAVVSAAAAAATAAVTIGTPLALGVGLGRYVIPTVWEAFRDP